MTLKILIDMPRKVVSSGLNFRDDRRGGILVSWALLSIGFVGVAGLTIDAGFAYVTKHRLQIAADQAVIAATNKLPDIDAAKRIAKHIVQSNLDHEFNGDVLAENDIEFGDWLSDKREFVIDSETPSAVRVTTKRAETNENALGTYFMGIFGITQLDITTSAIAMLKPADACIYVISTNAKSALKVAGGAEIVAPDCGVQVNSRHFMAAHLNENSKIRAASTCVVGDVYFEGGGSIDPRAETGCNEVADPLAGLSPPAYGGCTYNRLAVQEDRTLSPGVYCGGLSINSGASVTFRPGIYVIKDGTFKINGNSSVHAEGVGFYITGRRAQVDLSGGADLYISAPESGPMAGLIFYQGPDAPPKVKSKITGTGELHFEGAIYFPDQMVEWMGNSEITTDSPYTLLVVNTLEIAGFGLLKVGAQYARSNVPLPKGMTLPDSEDSWVQQDSKLIYGNNSRANRSTLVY